MHHTQVIQKSIAVVQQRGQEYGDASASFIRIASLATVLLNKAVSAYDVATILFAVKLGRIAHDRANDDSFVDGINYLAFMNQFAEAKLPKASIDNMLAEINSGLADAIAVAQDPK